MNISNNWFDHLLVNNTPTTNIPDSIDYKQFISLPKHELIKLKNAAELIRASENSIHCELANELLNHLIARFKSGVEWSIKSKLKFDWFSEPYTDACGCTGPRNGEPFCNCTMVRLCYIYRFDVALAILEKSSV